MAENRKNKRTERRRGKERTDRLYGRREKKKMGKLQRETGRNFNVRV